MPTYLEIGTSDFDTLNDQYANDLKWSGTSVEPIPEYFDRLTKHHKNKYFNLAVVPDNGGGLIDFFYVPSEVIKKHNLPDWLRGCGSTNQNHVSLVKFKEHVVKTQFKTIALVDLLVSIGPGCTSLDLLKIDTEGLDHLLLTKFLMLWASSHVIKFETTHMTSDECLRLHWLLIKYGYDLDAKDAFNVRYVKKTIIKQL